MERGLVTQDVSVAVVGLGFGANHARVLGEMPGARLVAVVDLDAERLDATPAGPETQKYTDFAMMLAEAKPQGVVVAVPAAYHVPVALQAIEADCAVLVEKPLAPSWEEGMRLLKAARHRGVGLMAGHIERFNPALQELVRRVHAGEIGRVIHVTARRMGAIRLPPRDVNVVHDSAVHDIDAMRCVLGAEVSQVYASARSGLGMPVEDSVSAVLQFEAQGEAPGAMAILEVNWLSPRRVRDLAVLGEKGLFVLRYAQQTLDLYRMPQRSGPVRGWSLAAAPEDGEVERIAVEPREQLVHELSAFVEAVRTGGPMPVSAEDGLAALRVADALTVSARSGQPVRLGDEAS